jgi:hypothetical protein
MLLLIFGSTLTQDFQGVSIQMVTVAFYIGLLAQLATIGFPWTGYDGANNRQRGEALMICPRNNISYKPGIAASQALLILRKTSEPFARHT